MFDVLRWVGGIHAFSTRALRSCLRVNHLLHSYKLVVDLPTIPRVSPPSTHRPTTHHTVQKHTRTRLLPCARGSTSTVPSSSLNSSVNTSPLVRSPLVLPPNPSLNFRLTPVSPSLSRSSLFPLFLSGSFSCVLLRISQKVSVGPCARHGARSRTWPRSCAREVRRRRRWRTRRRGGRGRRRSADVANTWDPRGSRRAREQGRVRRRRAPCGGRCGCTPCRRPARRPCDSRDRREGSSRR